MRQALLLLLGLLLTATACSPPEPKKVQGPHIFLVTLDTVRADHLGIYGYPRPTSPFVDRLAAQGVLFNRAYAHMATTVPSHASMFTALHPIQHQVLQNGHRLDDSVVTLAEVLDQAGYKTAAFVSTEKHFSPGNLHQGFQRFDEPTLQRGERYRRGVGTVSRALDWLEGVDFQQPVFVWVHLFDAHYPYHQAHRMPISTQERPALESLMAERQVDESVFGEGGHDLWETIELYDGEIRAADRQVERLFEYVNERLTPAAPEPAAPESAALGSTLWIVTSDHGEGLGSHRWLRHGRHLYDEQVRVPLILHMPGVFEAGVREDVVEHVDLMPTVLGVAGLQAPAGPLKRQGRSLVGAPGDNGDALAQRRSFGGASRQSGRFEAGEKLALRGARYKYILRTEGEDELYDLDEDVFEVQNLVGQGLDVEEELQQRLAQRIRELRQEALPGSQSVGEEAIEALKALGYVQ